MDEKFYTGLIIGLLVGIPIGIILGWTVIKLPDTGAKGIVFERDENGRITGIFPVASKSA